MSIKLLTKQHFECLSLNGCCTGSSESTLVKMPLCCKSHVAAHLYLVVYDENGINLNVRENHFPKSILPSVLHLYAYYVSKYLSIPTYISSNWIIEINMCHQYTAYILHEYVYGPLSEMIEINIFII